MVNFPGIRLLLRPESVFKIVWNAQSSKLGIEWMAATRKPWSS